MLIYCHDLGPKAIVRYSYCWLSQSGHGFQTQSDNLAPVAFAEAEKHKFAVPVTFVMVDEFGYHHHRFTI